MKRLPKALEFRVEDLGEVPEWAQNVLASLNVFAAQVNECLGRVAETAQALDKSFTTDAAGSASVDVSNQLDDNPSIVIGSGLRRVDGTALGSGWSMSSTLTSKGIRLLFVGLSASTKYRVSVEYH